VTTTLVEEKQLTPAPPPNMSKLDNVHQIPLGMIFPSPTNERREVDADFVASIRRDRVTSPIVVRPRIAKPEDVARVDRVSKKLAAFGPGDKAFEIVYGERRWEGSFKAGRQVIPAEVRELTDEQALELQIIENLQREDLSPLQEGRNYSKLMTVAKKTVQEVAVMVSKSPRTVWQAIQRARLVPLAIKLMESGQLSASHGDLLCPHTPEVQGTLLKWIEREDRYGGTPSVRELKAHIQQTVYLLLDAAPWKKDDATLVAKAGACTDCQKNTAVNRNLDPEAKKPTCTDPVCYESKRQSHLVQIETAVKASGQKVVRVSEDYSARPTKNNDFIPEGRWEEVKAGSCQYAVTGVIIDGRRASQKVTVCAEPKCTKHQSHGNFAGRASSTSNRDIDSHRAKQKLQQRKTILENAVRCAQGQELCKGVKKLALQDLRLIAKKTFERLWHDVKKPLCELMGWDPKKDHDRQAWAAVDKMKPAELAGFQTLLAIAGELHNPVNSYYGKTGDNSLRELARRHKVNIEAVRRRVTAEFKAKWGKADARGKAKAKKQTSAQAKKAKKAKGKKAA
jgi:ParB/RepB/Spo0J family partition protein